ncbi:hypothetical protein GOP47_0022818 [Adiantum capillus-veneris]|uniref:GDSL esterase/lipase n=1 Tax=Adiantum capillus-veneris TaxID=13818 RepID=A0A9D4U825_ADICA|nr:hypothetical protein GOP47_0022818 [Adiantum capillus-veneris]
MCSYSKRSLTASRSKCRGLRCARDWLQSSSGLRRGWSANTYVCPRMRRTLKVFKWEPSEAEAEGTEDDDRVRQYGLKGGKIKQTFQDLEECSFVHGLKFPRIYPLFLPTKKEHYLSIWRNMVSCKMQFVVGAAMVAFAAAFHLQDVKGATEPCYPALFVFGNSLSDTGNGLLTRNPLFTRTAERPYGETVPGYPFTRFSDGLLIVDFLETWIGLPLLQPYLDREANFNTGVNYAVSGATAETASSLRSRQIRPLTDLSLDVQVGWHLELKAFESSPQNPSTYAYTNGLYVLEIGGNDYFGALNSLIYSPSYITNNFIPRVMAKLRNATQVLYANGARNFLYISITPVGCLPSFLSMFPMGSKDSNGCLLDLNLLSYTHGIELLNLVNELRATYNRARFTFLDYYGAYIEVIENNFSYGFSNTLDACCGAGPSVPYRYNIILFCNSLSSTALSTLCPNPNVFINWDGIHFTHRFNSQIFNLTIGTGSYLSPSNAFATCNASPY